MDGAGDDRDVVAENRSGGQLWWFSGTAKALSLDEAMEMFWDSENLGGRR